MPNELFPDLAARLGLQRRPESDDDFALAQRRELAEQARRDLTRGRSTVVGGFDPDGRAKAQSHRERRLRSDASLIAQLLSGLLRGQIVGLNLPQNLFDDVLNGFFAALTELGAVVRPPVPAPNSANRTALVARGIGVTGSKADAIQPATPRSVRRFHEFMAQIPASPADDLPAGIAEAASALLGATRAAARANDRAALQLIGSDLGSLSAALMGAAAGPNAQREVRTRASGAPMVDIGDGVFADFDDCERGPDGKPRLKAGRGSAQLRRRVKGR